MTDGTERETVTLDVRLSDGDTVEVDAPIYEAATSIVGEPNSAGILPEPVRVRGTLTVERETVANDGPEEGGA